MPDMELEPRPGHVVAMAELPPCDICKQAHAVWDAKMYLGPWAYMCEPCAAKHALIPGETGVGVGQRLVLRGI